MSAEIPQPLLITEVPTFDVSEAFDSTPPELGGHQLSIGQMATLREGLRGHVAVEPVPEAPGEAADTGVESASGTRLDYVFAAFEPTETTSSAQQAEESAKMLLNEDVVRDATMARVESGTSKRTEVTDESLKEADEWLKIAVQADPALRKILVDGTPGVKTQPELAAALRENQQLRVAVGEHFLRKAAALVDSMPDQVRRNAGKTPTLEGYPSGLSSREYAALLALSMLDGTFKAPTDGSALEGYDPVTDKGGGQHRYAARQLLATIN